MILVIVVMILWCGGAHNVFVDDEMLGCFAVIGWMKTLSQQ